MKINNRDRWDWENPTPYDEIDDDSLNPTDPPHCFILDAAVGWLGLGNPLAALKELEELDQRLKYQPDVMQVSWCVHALLEDWEMAHQIATDLMRVIPDDIKSWLYLAESTRYVDWGGIEAGYKVLLPAAKRFKENRDIHFNLACYACQAGRPEEAVEWLFWAGKLGSVKEFALEDPDLESIREFAKTLQH